MGVPGEIVLRSTGSRGALGVLETPASEGAGAGGGVAVQLCLDGYSLVRLQELPEEASPGGPWTLVCDFDPELAPPPACRLRRRESRRGCRRQTA